MVSIGDWTAAGSGRRADFDAKGLRKQVALFVLPAIACSILALIAWAGLAYNIPVELFTRDMAAILNVHPLMSVVSSLGAFMMCATAAVCLFACAVARGNCRAAPRHLLAIGLLSLYLLADDFYEFHERLFPRELGIPDWATYAAIATAAAGIAFVWRRQFLAHRPWMLGAALVFLGGSIGFDLIDAFTLPMGSWAFFMEDSAKFVGISLWATYFMSMAGAELLKPP